MSTRKKLLYGLLASCLVLASLELLLALAGVRPLTADHDPLVGFSASSPLFVASSERPGYLETAPARHAHFNRQTFPRVKKKGARRILCLGGSTTYGRPYDDKTSYVGWLRKLLPVVVPEESWELVNAGGISYASYRLALLSEQLLSLEPDLIVIYTGHNEFLEERTYPVSQRPSYLVQQVTRLASRSRIYSSLFRTFRGHPSSRKAAIQLPEEVDEILNHTVGPVSYHRNDVQRDLTLDHFRFNLARIARLARRDNVPVLFIVPASNLRSFSPFKSEPDDRLSADQLDQHESHVREALALQLNGDPTGAREQLQLAAGIDSRQAETQFRLGHALLAEGDNEAALLAFQRARDEDVCPLRALSGITRIVRETANSERTWLVDFERLLADQCKQVNGHPIPGDELFLDHVHPTLEGHRLLAEAIIEELAERSWISLGQAWNEETRQHVRQQLLDSVDPLQHAVSERNLAKVLNWAGKHMEAGPLALSALERLPRDPEALSIAAAYQRSRGRADEAVSLMRRRLQLTPDDSDSLKRLGALLVDLGRTSEAVIPFRKLVDLAPADVAAHLSLGIVLLELDQPTDALRVLGQAEKLDDQNADIHYHLGLAHAGLDDWPRAAAEFGRALELNPADSDARHNLELARQHLR